MSITQGLLQEPNALNPQAKFPALSFLGVQTLQIVWFSFSLSFSENFFVLPIHVAFALFNFIICQRYFGRQLVGLSWKFNIINPTELFWSHEIEPDPFVPTKANSNIFWVGMAGSTTFWLLSTAMAIISHVANDMTKMISFSVFVLHCVNLVVFFKIQRIATKLSANAVKTVLLGKGEFPNAEEFSASSDNESGNENDENKSADEKSEEA